MQAHGVPMAVPMFWRHHVLPNWKILLFITRSSRSVINVFGRCRCDAKVLMYCLIVGIPSEGSILVYIDVASDVQSLDPGGKDRVVFSFCITSNEFFT